MPPIAPANQPANAPANNMAQQLDDLRNDLRNELRDELREEFRIQMARQLAQAECQVRNDLRNEIAQRLGELRSDLRDEIRNLRQEADASDFNAIARGMNSTIFQPQLDLHPLRNRKTNAVIEGFPRTVADIDEMTGKIPVFEPKGLRHANLWSGLFGQRVTLVESCVHWVDLAREECLRSGGGSGLPSGLFCRNCE
ncbi:hypothetical protein RB594_006382 [Gaeumannomyces avenae]